MLSLFITIVSLAVSAVAFGQEVSIQGRIMDNNLVGIAASNVVLYGKDNATLAATLSDSSGHFALKPVIIGEKAVLEVSHPSYFTRYFNITGDTSIVVCLQEASRRLNEAVVVGAKPAIEFKEGNLVANVSSIPNASSLSVDKLLARLPGVTAGAKEGLTLNGIPATLYIDGRKQIMPGSGITTLLQALPAAAIDQVELIAIASGVYDASDSGAVINLKTKKQRLDGYYLNIGGDGSADAKDGKADGGGRAFYMFKKKNILFNSTLSYLHNYWWTTTDDDIRYANGAFLNSTSDYHSYNNIYSGLANLTWRVKNNHALNFNVFYWGAFNHNSTEQPTKITDGTGGRDYVLSARGRNRENLWTGNIEYASPDSLPGRVVASYGIVYAGLRDEKDFFNCLQPQDNKEWYLNSNAQMAGYRHAGKIDFTHSFKQIGLRLMAGAKADIGILDDDVVHAVPSDREHYPESHFSGRENIYGGYARAIYDINKKWAINGAIRLEHTDYDINLSSGNINTGNAFTNYFPYFHLYYKHSQNYQSTWAIATGISRPNYEHLLPGIRYSDEFSYSVGNPHLKPTLTNSVAWVHYLYGYGNISLYYSYLKDLEGPVLTGKENGVREYTYLNYADGRRFQVSAYLPFEFFNKKLSGNISGYVQHVAYMNQKNGFVIPENRNSFWRWNIKGFANYQVSDRLSIYAWTGYNPSYSTPQLDYKSNWAMDLGVSYALLRDNKLMFTLDAENIFNTSGTQHVYYYDGNVLSRNMQRGDRFIKAGLVFKLHGGEKIEHQAKENVSDVSRFSTRSESIY